MNTKPELRRFDVTIPTNDGKLVAETISVMVPMEWDNDASDWILTPEAMDLIDETKARHMGLLTPKEIRELRDTMGFTQEQMADMLKLGAKTWSRWETGRQRPSQSLNLLLRALKVGALTAFQLRQLSFPIFDWSAAVSAKAVEPEPITMPFASMDAATMNNYEEMPLAS